MLKFNPTILFAIALLFSNCKTKTRTVEQYQNPLENFSVKDLKTDEEISQFLTKLNEQDQYLRNNQPKVNTPTHHNSQARLNHAMQQIESDKINLQKAMEFINLHGFPDPDKHGALTSKGILYVFHHSSKDNVARHQYLPAFYEAYQEGKIEEDLFDLYLGRMYDLEFGKRMKMESPFKPADRIQKYLEAFDFSPK